MTQEASSAYRRSDGHSASPVRLVVLLYEQLIKDLQRALAAMEKKDIGLRTNEISHALSVLGQLQGTLDLQKGGVAAKNLDRYYFSLRRALLKAQTKVSPSELREQINILLELREAWVQVERSTQAANELPATTASGFAGPLEKTLSWSI